MPIADASKIGEAFPRLHGGPHYVRFALQHGAARFSNVADRSPVDGFALRGFKHAHYGAHRAARLHGDRQRRKALYTLSAQRRRAVDAWAERCALAVQ